MQDLEQIYLDYNAATPLDPAVLEAMLPYFSETFANTASQLHEPGRMAMQALQEARKRVANCLECKADEIFFTSGATESNNWVLRGILDQHRLAKKPGPIHIIASCVEHNSILKFLEQAAALYDFSVDLLPVNQFGQIDLSSLAKTITDRTALVSIIWAQNELGSLNKMREISNMVRSKGVLLHSDATQAMGKVAISFDRCPMDLVSFSAHKFYGPKGIGALYIRSGVQLSPLFYGGGHETGLRSGTVNLPGVIGLSKALELACSRLPEGALKLQQLTELFLKELGYRLGSTNFQVNTDLTSSLPGVVSLSFPKHHFPIKFKGLALSQGSACHSGRTEGTPSLRAIGLSPELASRSLRVSFGHPSRPQDAIESARRLAEQLIPFTEPLGQPKNL